MKLRFLIDDQYNICDKGMFIGQSTLPTLYRQNKKVIDLFDLHKFITESKGGKKPLERVGS